MKDINYFVLKSGTIIRKDIISIQISIEFNSVISEGTLASATYEIRFSDIPNVVFIGRADYLELKEILC